MAIKNYTTQTNSHRGYTIEELKRLFNDGKQITSENLKKLISECFNYELVSGNGIRILELKNNDYKNNTTKTYKLECTHMGDGGSGDANISAEKGVTLDESKQNTVIADLCDYERFGTIEDDGIYPVSLSKDGKLIVDMNQSDIKITAASESPTHIFEDKDLYNWFTFNYKIEGSRLTVYKIETWIKEGDDIVDNSMIVYDDESQEVQDLNNNKSLTLNLDCSARIDENDVNVAITRKGVTKVYYKIKTKETKEQEPKIASAQTKFMHQIYYGYTCDYLSETGSDYINPVIKEWNQNYTNQPCFKVYSPNTSDYVNSCRTGLTLTKNGDNYDLKITNVETKTEYVLGYFNMNSSQDGKHTLSYLPSSKTFSLIGLSSNEGESVFMVFLIPKSMGNLTKMNASIDDGVQYNYLDTLVQEKVVIQDYTYYNDGNRVIDGIEYTTYTMINGFSQDVNNIKMDCETSTF